jgi:signal transduction histidine kinase
MKAFDPMSFFLGVLFAAVMALAMAGIRRRQRKSEGMEISRNTAHELNNILTVISGNIELIERKIGNDPKLKDMAESALASVDKAKKLIEAARAASRKST